VGPLQDICQMIYKHGGALHPTLVLNFVAAQTGITGHMRQCTQTATSPLNKDSNTSNPCYPKSSPNVFRNFVNAPLDVEVTWPFHEDLPPVVYLQSDHYNHQGHLSLVQQTPANTPGNNCRQRNSPTLSYTVAVILAALKPSSNTSSQERIKVT
jgi:hypothetical protein